MSKSLLVVQLGVPFKQRVEAYAKSEGYCTVAEFVRDILRERVGDAHAR